jgi:hypothetical protein
VHKRLESVRAVKYVNMAILIDFPRLKSWNTANVCCMGMYLDINVLKIILIYTRKLVALVTSDSLWGYTVSPPKCGESDSLSRFSQQSALE